VLKDLSPDLIDHIEVIKGNAAVSLYGERGRNGVIIITLKKPR
jgi:TonB-dependent SusC/RagA subfamily outer membrane receptor